MIMKAYLKSSVVGVVFALLIGGLFSACNSSEKKNSEDKTVSSDLVTNPITASGNKVKSDLPVMEFETDKHDFGLIMEGEKVAHTFIFTNAGGSDLLISSASSTCGCTVPTFSKEPIKPGEKGKIEVIFNSAGKPGANHKQVKILTNAQPNTVELSITAEVYNPQK